MDDKLNFTILINITLPIYKDNVNCTVKRCHSVSCHKNYAKTNSTFYYLLLTAIIFFFVVV